MTYLIHSTLSSNLSFLDLVNVARSLCNIGQTDVLLVHHLHLRAKVCVLLLKRLLNGIELVDIEGPIGLWDRLVVDLEGQEAARVKTDEVKAIVESTAMKLSGLVHELPDPTNVQVVAPVLEMDICAPDHNQ